jgi:hypothetical protein
MADIMRDLIGKLARTLEREVDRQRYERERRDDAASTNIWEDQRELAQQLKERREENHRDFFRY